MIFAEETFKEVFEEIQELLKKHKEEIGMFGKDIELDPDWEMYKTLAEAGILNIITMRMRGHLLGYYISFIVRHLHYNVKVSSNDILYIEKGYRGHALSFFKYIQKNLKVKGIIIMSFNIKPIVDFRTVAEYLGFELLEYTYFKRLDKWQEQ